MKGFTICLWFDNDAEEAARFYTSIFKDSRMGDITRFGKAGYEIHQRPEGSVMSVSFFLNGQEFMGLNGGPMFTFSEAVSFQVNCETQKEIDYYWEKLSEGGPADAQQCGWLKDKYGVSWQVVPSELLSEYARKGDPARYDKMMQALMPMKKLDMAALKQAYES